MLYYTAGQWQIFLFLAGAGAICGCWYTLMGHIAGSLAPGPWLQALMDCFTALGIWLILSLALLRACWGEVRLYALAGAGLGFFLQKITLGDLSFRLVKKGKKRLLALMGKISRKKWIKILFR